MNKQTKHSCSFPLILHPAKVSYSKSSYEYPKDYCCLSCAGKYWEKKRGNPVRLNQASQINTTTGGANGSI